MFRRESDKHYYVPGIDEIHQLVETPASKEQKLSFLSILSVSGGLPRPGFYQIIS